MRLPSIVALFPACFAAVSSVAAHPGGLNAQGCHTNRKTGEYHCHRSTVAIAQAPTGRVRAYRNCAEARAAGAAPVRVGDPGYTRKLDRDGDGIGCE
jgi:hypothetical protein